MQPITQGSLDPKLKDIRHLRAEQSLLGAVGWLGLAILHRGTERVLRCGEVLRQRVGLPDFVAPFPIAAAKQDVRMLSK